MGMSRSVRDGGMLDASVGAAELSGNSRPGVSLHVEPPLALVVLELPAGGSEGIAQRDVRVFVSVIGRVCLADRDLRIGKRDVDVEVVQPALVLVMRRRLDDHVTAHDLWTEPLESGGELANASFESGRGFHVTKGDL